ncbi:MAG: hypothetical protein K2F93_05040, partial [Muribaculaceae bacterium]|nr:hypothetical protein [Muribaculaceae bacterium]
MDYVGTAEAGSLHSMAGSSLADQVGLCRHGGGWKPPFHGGDHLFLKRRVKVRAASFGCRRL